MVNFNIHTDINMQTILNYTYNKAIMITQRKQTIIYNNVQLVQLTGIRKAKVFPLPVFAAPRISKPRRLRPILSCCISVGFINPHSFNPLIVLPESGKSLKEFTFVASIC